MRAQGAAPLSRREMAEWVGWCAAAEIIGMTVAAAAARAAGNLLSDSTSLRMVAAWAALIGAGCIEALGVGLAQSGALRRRVPRLNSRRFVLVTVAVATLFWAAGELPVLTSEPDSLGSSPPMLLLALGGLGLGLVTGCLMGLVQMTVLPRGLRHRWTWVGGSVTGWALAMAVIMVGASSPGTQWPLTTVLAWAALTGAAAGGLLGLTLAWFAVSLDGRPVSSRVILRALRTGRPRWLGRSVIGLRVTGRVSGTTYEFPVIYVVQGDALWVMVGRSTAKTWWRNVSRSTRVELLRDGRWVPATAEMVSPTDPGFLNGLSWYLACWPRAKPAPEDPLVRLRMCAGPSDPELGSYGPARFASTEPGLSRTSKE